MKKIVLFAAALLAGYTAKAQGFYLDASVGYGFGTSTSNFGTKVYNDYGDATKNTVENIYGTLGNGINVAVTPGYFINDNFGIELGIQGFFGLTTRVADITSNDDLRYDFTEAKTTQLRVIPTLVVSSGNSKKLSVYGKAGLLMPVIGATYGYNESMAPNAALGLVSGGTVTHVKTEAETVTKGNFTVGFRGAIGVNFKVTDKIALFAEVQHTSLTIKPKKRTVESYKVNGVDITKEAYIVNGVNASGIQLGNASGIMDESRLVTEYVDALDANSNTSTNPNFDKDKATQALPSKTNFSQLGLNIGVKFNF